MWLAVYIGGIFFIPYLTTLTNDFFDVILIVLWFFCIAAIPIAILDFGLNSLGKQLRGDDDRRR